MRLLCLLVLIHDNQNDNKHNDHHHDTNDDVYCVVWSGGSLDLDGDGEVEASGHSYARHSVDARWDLDDWRSGDFTRHRVQGQATGEWRSDLESVLGTNDRGNEGSHWRACHEIEESCGVVEKLWNVGQAEVLLRSVDSVLTLSLIVTDVVHLARSGGGGTIHGGGIAVDSLAGVGEVDGVVGDLGKGESLALAPRAVGTVGLVLVDVTVAALGDGESVATVGFGIQEGVVSGL